MKSIIHRISIPSILEISPDSTKNIGKILSKNNFKFIILLYDEQIKSIFGNQIEKSLKENNISFETLIVDSIDFSIVSKKAFSINNKIEAFLALGGGKVLDAAKYMAFLRKLPFISIPTSTSNDGFCSPVASLFIQNKRTTVPARIPYGIIVDTNILSSAPSKFIFSGIGDLVSNITALWDWRFEEENNKTKIDDFALMISQKSAKNFLNLPFHSIYEKDFLEELVYCLTMNGISMEISGSSSPASGSEHLISHALDKILDIPYLHGIQVGIATYIVSILQNQFFSEINSIFQNTGFWEYAKTLQIKKQDLKSAIDLAPSIKPQRYTILHIHKNQQKAKEIIEQDSVLQNILL